MTKEPTFKVLWVIVILGISFVLMVHGRQGNYDHYDHPDDHHHEHDQRTIHPDADQAKLVTGQGDFIFSWDEGLTAAFPREARKFESQMHGGFNEDPGTGMVYTGIPGYGLCSISPDLTQWTLLGSDERLKDNIHGITFFIHKGRKQLAVAQEGRRILVLNLDGSVVSELLKPVGDEFYFAPANDFFLSGDSDFGVTDVTYLDGILYVAHGYSRGDFVLTIKEENGSWSWGKLAWGGKGDNPGEFQTAHGVFAHDNHILVANRAAGQVVKFTREGKYVEIFKDVPDQSLICNVSFDAAHFFFNALRAIDSMTSAPIYAHTGTQLVSTIIPGDLKIPILNNIHHVWPHYVTTKTGSRQLYLLVHGWNEGKFAVLKLEE